MRWVEWVDLSRHIGTISPYSAIHVGSRSRKTNNTEAKHNPQKANNAKHSKTKLPLFSSRLFWHSVRKQDGLILQRSRAHTLTHTHLWLGMSPFWPWTHTRTTPTYHSPSKLPNNYSLWSSNAHTLLSGFLCCKQSLLFHRHSPPDRRQTVTK